MLFGYGLNYLIDLKHAVIVDVQATPARTYDEVAATSTMIERTRRRRSGLRVATAPSRRALCSTYRGPEVRTSAGFVSDLLASIKPSQSLP